MVAWLCVVKLYRFLFSASLEFLSSQTTPVEFLTKSCGCLRPALEHFDGYLSRQAQTLLQATSDGMYSKKTLSDGRVQVTGGKRLKSSGAYTPAFGRKVAKLFLKRPERVAWIV